MISCTYGPRERGAPMGDPITVQVRSPQGQITAPWGAVFELAYVINEQP